MKEINPEEFNFRGWAKFLTDEMSSYKKFYSDWIKTELVKVSGDYVRMHY